MYPSTTLFVSLVQLVLLISPASAIYIWPDPAIDDLESAYVTLNFAGILLPCSSSFPGGPGIQTAAEWLRTAYHDMATADVTTGSGGIDASIGFETNRPENAGAAFNDSLEFFTGVQTPHASMSDVIALGAIFAVRACGTSAIDIPFRVGRVDALQAGPPGVPEPQNDLNTHIADFKRQGFNVTEMIGLVACGHTIGGIHGEDFPNITANISEPDTLGQTVHFDSTFDTFDNRVATQFVSNTSQDALVIGPTETDSDLRIFNADGGALIKELANSNDRFISNCKSLLERMVNTVPKGVTLSEPITPIAVKPEFIALSLNDDGETLQFSGDIRVLNTNNLPPNQVLLHITGRDGVTPSTTITTTAAGFAITGFFGNFTRFNFNGTIPVDRGISSFIVEIKEHDDRLTINTNGGHGFPVLDTAVFRLQDSCLNFRNSTRNFTLAVRDDARLSSLQLEWFIETGLPGTAALKFSVQTSPMVKSSPVGRSGYTTYFGNSTFDVLEDFFGGTYDIVGKDIYGKDVRITGPPAFNVNFCGF